MEAHLVGGDPWWHQVIGPALIAGTAIVAAWFAARTANRRQQEQLSHDRMLQEAQLVHDREQRNRQHVRDTIDSAVRGLYAAMKQSAEYQGLILTGDEKRDEYRRIIDDETLAGAERDAAVRDYREAMDRVGAATIRGFEASTELMGESLRLSLRLGVEHPICKSHTAYYNAYQACFEILHDLPTDKITDEDRERIKAADADEGAAMREFLNSCRTWFEDEQGE